MTGPYTPDRTHDTLAHVLDAQGRRVSRHDVISDAYAEAERLNGKQAMTAAAAPATGGSHDVFGYLRWTSTSCRRCGYEQPDCTCIGGFSAPRSQETTMPVETSEIEIERVASTLLYGPDDMVAETIQDAVAILRALAAANAQLERERDAAVARHERVIAAADHIRQEVDLRITQQAALTIQRNAANAARAKAEGERDRLRKLVERAFHSMPHSYNSWRYEARAALTPAPEAPNDGE